MLKFEETKIEAFEFGESKNDTFYSLTNIKKNPDGLDVEKLSKTSPLRIDEVLNEMGCIVLLSSDDAEKILGHNDITVDELHKEIYDKAKEEGLLN